MKKLVLMFAAAVMAVSASAQTTQESKFFDNWYLGDVYKRQIMCLFVKHLFIPITIIGQEQIIRCV